MSKHELAATDLDDERVVWILPDPDPKAERGWRIRVDKIKGELLVITEEQVLPERVDNPNAHRLIATSFHNMFSRAQIEWLNDVLGEVLALKEEW